MVRSCKGIEMLVNLINISYCAMKILPYQNEHFSEYRTKSVQEFRFELSQGIRSQIFFATFVKNIETHIKSNAMTKALKQLIHQQVYVDMKNREIHVGGQLVYYEGDEGYCFHDSETKTDAGIRDIPMTQMVYDAFRKQRELNLMLGLQSNVEIGGRSGFIFNTKHGRPIMPAGVNSFLKNIVNAYNKKESKLAEEEKREPELMPPISSHTLRHTGCTRLGENNVNPKVMQYVMGCWMSGGHPFSTDRSGAKNIQMHRLQ